MTRSGCDPAARVWTSAVGEGAGDIFVMRADGSDVRRVTDDAFEEATPTFAPSRSLTTR